MPSETEQEAKLTKALALIALAYPIEGDLKLDGLYADPYEAEGLLDCGVDYSGEGYCALSKSGKAFVNDVLAARFTPSREDA